VYPFSAKSFAGTTYSHLLRPQLEMKMTVGFLPDETGFESKYSDFNVVPSAAMISVSKNPNSSSAGRVELTTSSW
jgi:hypothetical protein